MTADGAFAGSAARATGTTAAPRAPRVPLDRLDAALVRARENLLGRQAADGHWCFELEADCTIPAEYVLMEHFLGEVDEVLERKVARYLRLRQTIGGGWPLYVGGEIDLSATVKAYYALKLAGDDPDAPHMRAAREAVLARGGAARSNVFTRITLALFEQVPWRATPFLPVEIVLLPQWSPFHLAKVSYWSRAVMVPLAILTSTRARAANPSGTGIRELFATPPEAERDWFPPRSPLNRMIFAMERSARLLEPAMALSTRQRALREAERWFVARLNGVDGLGCIFPAMVNALEALHVLGYPSEHPLRVRAKEALRRLVVDEGAYAYVQPCVSPVWDTAIAALALGEVDRAFGDRASAQPLHRACAWLRSKQILDGEADWREAKPWLAPGGWAFQYENAYYPDLDDTSMVAWALHENEPDESRDSLARAADWVRGMQSRDGGFASFDADNTALYLNEIPFADHGALLDPPTADVTARCAGLFAMLGRPEDRPALARALDYLFAEQEPSGAWFGRWGTNYVYGTWSVLAALEHVPDPRRSEAVRRAARWLEDVQRPDGSWGESNDTYFRPEDAGTGGAGTPFQTAWAMLALCAAGRGDGDAVRRAAAWLLGHQEEDGGWSCDEFTAPGFPRVFHLLYHGYRLYFPIWALARARRAAAE